MVSLIISSALSVMLVMLSELTYIPMMFIIPVAVYSISSENKRTDPRKLMNESPTVIGMMSSVIIPGGSLDTAVRYVSDNGPPISRKMFRKVVRETDLRTSDVKNGMIACIGDIHNDASPFKRSMHMLISASETSDPGERKRMIDDAESISLTGLKEMGDTYSSSLNNPCMMIFGLGVMVPMILMSVLPMLSMGGMFSVGALNTGTIAFLTLAVIPAVVSLVIISIVHNNPFHERNITENRTFAVFVSVLPMFVSLYIVTNDVFTALMVSMIVSGIVTFAATFRTVSSERAAVRTETSLQYILFELGNRLLSGNNFEDSMTDALGTRKECVRLSKKFGRCIHLFRGDTAEALNTALKGYSKETVDAYVRVYEASRKDTRDSGRLSISIGHQMQDRMHVKRNIRNKLKSITDMMTGTSVLFAPMIMGMSIVLLKPMSSISGMAVDGSVMLVLAIYLVELALLISVLTSYLSNNGNVNSIANRFGMIMPSGLMIFALFSGLNV